MKTLAAAAAQREGGGDERRRRRSPPRLSSAGTAGATSTAAATFIRCSNCVKCCPEVKGKKASWSSGSSFPLKKPVKVLPKIQHTDETDLIDEGSILTEEDLKRPELPVVRDCEVEITRNACSNCTCGLAEAEQKVEK